MTETTNSDHDQTKPVLARRKFLAGLGGAAASTVAFPHLVAAESARPLTADIAVDLDLDEIQGNVLPGFNNHHQALILVGFPSSSDGRAWLAAVRSSVASAREVTARSGLSNTSWVNIALSHPGLIALGRPRSELSTFPVEFRAGLVKRANTVGDLGVNAVKNWPAPLQQVFHAVVIVAADQADDRQSLVQQHQQLAAQHGVEVRHVEYGDARVDEPGHEHFGFRDGISQPGVRGFTVPANPDDAEQGAPGQDLLWPGEFVLGYPSQAGPGADVEVQGPIATSGPDWTKNGSYLVFRRLRQDVAGFRAFIRSVAKDQGLSEDLAGAKIVGRYKSGAPLALTGEQDTDPGLTNPALLSDEQINDFEFVDDGDLNGDLVPLAAHIRKTYPRDHPTDDGGEADTQRHRVLRRGIPFGASLAADATPDSAAALAEFPNDRGLLFLCYQTSIARQFEHVQQQWVNDPTFPEPNAGQDAIIATAPKTGEFSLPGGRTGHVALMQRFVTTTGGGYFFQPSLSALATLSAAPPADVPTTPRPPRPNGSGRRPRPGRPSRGRGGNGGDGEGTP
ncbi:MAG: Dyp-type peroxidase [Actinomycetia bacterium]|nr:Dyp-type peroxidase [Actinomycetes bacterium]